MACPFISIITPTKNSEASIESTLQSVAIQDYDSFEHIIIDSRSTDSTLNIVKKYSHTYTLNYFSEEDSGISEAFNKGIKMSSGKWLIFLGSGDEFFSPSVLTEVDESLRESDDKFIVWGNIIYKDHNGNRGKLERGLFPKKRLKRYMCLPHQAAFHKRDLFDTYGLYDTEFKHAMDYDLCLRIYNVYDFGGYIDKNISYMLVGGTSQIGDNAIREYLSIQKKHGIWHSNSIVYTLYYWAILKKIVKGIIGYNIYGIKDMSC